MGTKRSWEIDGGAPSRLRQHRRQADGFGYAAGFGLEWAFAGNWWCRLVRLMGLRDRGHTVAAGTPTFGGDVITFNNRSISTMTVALNYKFGGW